MARTEERGWYIADIIWTGEASRENFINRATTEASEIPGSVSPEDEADPDTFTMPADESRDRCVVCGINFQMLFDNDDGIYKYKNCREIEVLTDDAAMNESELVLVHVTCWRGLGSPPILTMDQTIQDALRY